MLVSYAVHDISLISFLIQYYHNGGASKACKAEGILFCRFNVSDRMYNEFLRPTLLVGLFAEPENLSAAAVLNTLYFYGMHPA